MQQAAVVLRTVAAQLPVAQANVARAKGELAGAQAKLAASKAAVARAEAARSAAQVKVDGAGAKVQKGRDDVGQLARRTYQRGRLGALQDVMEAGEPQDVLDRTGMLRSVFRYQDGTLDRLTKDRLALARTEADLAADEREVNRLKAAAEEGEQRARQITTRAQTAADQVASLVASQQAALAVAESERARDERDYRKAQAASRELAERIRAAAAAEEARQRAAAAAEAAARERAAVAAEETRQRAATSAEAAARERAAAAAEESRRRAAAAAEAAARAAADRAARERADAAGRPAPAPLRPGPVAGPTRTGSMLWPAPGRLTSRYGNRVHPLFGTVRFHAGIDIGGGLGARVSAADGGTVIQAGPASGYGTLVVVSHGTVNGRNLATAYAHMGSIAVRVGQVVSRGQQVGTIGSEGNSTGPHLHFEVRVNGDPVDPLAGYVTPP